MSKNNKLINSLAEIARRNRENNILKASEKDTPQIYSAVAIALWRNLDGTDEEKAEAIETIFADSQKIWDESFERGIEIEKMCEEETGICIRGESKNE